MSTPRCIRCGGPCESTDSAARLYVRSVGQLDEYLSTHPAECSEFRLGWLNTAGRDVLAAAASQCRDCFDAKPHVANAESKRAFDAAVGGGT